MEDKVVKTGHDTQAKIIEGVSKAVSAIKSTLGPSGKCVAINMNGFTTEITRDGATVAKNIQFKDQEMNMGAELVKKAASATEEVAGDSTSTTSILIEEFCKRGQRAINSGANVNEVKLGMLKARAKVEQYIKENAILVDGDMEKIRKVATISANNDPEVGDLVVKGLSEVGLNGLVTADLASGLDTVIETTAGMKIERGWSSPNFVTNPEDGTCVMENPYVLVASEHIGSIKQMVDFIQDYDQNSQGRPLLMIVDEIDDNANMMLAINVMRGAIRCCVVKGIDFGDSRRNIMEDVSVAVGGIHICPENNITMTQANILVLGQAKKVVVTKDSCVIYEGMGDPGEVKNRAEILKARLADPKTSDYEKTKFEKRLANLTGGIAIIKAGGASEAEKANRKATIEDSILAAKSAIEEGCVPGGGYTFLRAAMSLTKDKKFWKELTEDEAEGAKIVVNSLPIIMHTIAENSGVSGDVIVKEAKSLKSGFGYNAKTGKVVDLVEDGILDSAKSLRVSLENSISAASMILLVDCTITDDLSGKDGAEPATKGMMM